MSERSSLLMISASFVVGVATALIGKRIYDEQTKKNKTEEHAGAIIEGDDLSLYYGNIQELTTITETRKFLPKDVYSRIVLDTVVVCVDILLIRFNETTNQKEYLLVERSSEPVKGYWWLPGGRMYKGETFFDAAKRKAQQETGISNVQPIQILGIWNTMFPTSHWDTKTNKGTQTVNPIVLVEVQVNNDSRSGTPEVKLDNTSENYKWVPLSIEYAEDNNVDKYVKGALYRLQAWNPNYFS